MNVGKEKNPPLLRARLTTIHSLKSQLYVFSYTQEQNTKLLYISAHSGLSKNGFQIRHQD